MSLFKSAWFAPPRAYILLFLLALAFRVATAWPVERAGYMDASYTQHVAQQAAAGRGLTEEVLWNYLDDPAGLPHPSNLYWLPLPTLLVWPWMLILGPTYRAAQLPFILLSAFLPLFAYYLADRFSHRHDYAWTAGLLATFSGFYTIYWVAPDNFTPFAITATLAVISCGHAVQREARVWWLATGVCIGLSHLARADGFLLLVIVPVALWLGSKRQGLRPWIWALGLTLLGYAVIVVPWFARNIAVTGMPLARGALQTVFLRDYDEFFRLAVQDLTLARFLEWGTGPILQSRLNALGTNLLVVLLGVLAIIQAPFVAISIWRWRKQPEVAAFALYALCSYLVLSLVFTFPSIRGSMLHSSAALVPFSSALAPAGLDSAVAWVARRRRRWDPRTAQLFFRFGLIALAFGLSVLLYLSGVIGGPFGGTPVTPLWNNRDREYRAVGESLDRMGVDRTQPILTMDPPSFVNDTGRRSIVIPTDSVEAVFQAAGRYGARYLVLQYDHPRGLDDLYLEHVPIPGLLLVERYRDGLDRPTFLYRVEAPAPPRE